MNAGLRYLGALRGHLNGDKNALVSEYTQGKGAVRQRTVAQLPLRERHPVRPCRHAPCGRSSRRSVSTCAPLGDATGTVDVVAEVTLKGLGTSGNPANIIDGDTSTYAHFSGSNATTNVNVGDSFTITYEPYQRADAVTFVQSVPSNRPQDVLKDALVEYTTDGTTWAELGHVNGDSEQTLLPKTTDLKGLRFTNKQYYSGYWQVNEVATSVATSKSYEPFASEKPAQGELSAIVDGDVKTGASFDAPAKGMNAGLSYVKTTEIGMVEIAQGEDARSGKVEALIGGAWTKIGTFDAKASQTVELEKNTAVNGVRLVVEGEGAWNLNEVAAKRLPSKVTPVMNETMGEYESFTIDKIADGNEDPTLTSRTSRTTTSAPTTGSA